MRWDLLDRFELLKRGERSRAVKAFTGAEDFFCEHHPGRPALPETLMIEMIAQTAGVLFGLELDFSKEVILAKVSTAAFGAPVPPPCALTIEARFDERREDAALMSGSVSCGGRVAARATLLLVAMDGLGGERKIVFNDRFLEHYDVRNVARRSEGAAR